MPPRTKGSSRGPSDCCTQLLAQVVCLGDALVCLKMGRAVVHVCGVSVPASGAVQVVLWGCLLFGSALGTHQLCDEIWHVFIRGPAVHRLRCDARFVAEVSTQHPTYAAGIARWHALFAGLLSCCSWGVALFVQHRILYAHFLPL
jgi:hypothetical protein